MAIDIPRVTASGEALRYHMDLTHDEAMLLGGLRVIKQQGSGDFLIKMESGRYTTWSCKPDLGNVTILNEALGIFR